MKKKGRSHQNQIHVMILNDTGWPKTVKVRINFEGDDNPITARIPNKPGMFEIGDVGRDFLNNRFGDHVACVEILKE